MTLYSFLPAMIRHRMALVLAALVGFAATGLPSVLSAAPVVILKLDDLRDSDQSRTGFEKAFAVIRDKNVRAGFGVIGNSCDDDGRKQSYYNLLKTFANSGRIEIWHHGYTHAKGELAGRGEAEQLADLRKTIDLLISKCGIAIHSFGAPFNADDANTVRALNAIPQIKVWMFPKNKKGSNKILLTKRVNMETSTGVVNYDFFVTNFNANADTAYMVIQGHPPYWNEQSLRNFEKVVDFLKNKGAVFMTPYGYAQSAKHQ